MDKLALSIQVVAALLTVCGMIYGLIALWAARSFEQAAKYPQLAGFGDDVWPGVSILKPMKGVDARLYTGLVSHCLLRYPGEIELLFGVSSLDDPAVAEIARLRVEYPKIDIRLVECPQQLGPNGKVSNLAQMLPRARFEYIVINDSDIRVSPRYLTRVIAPFAAEVKGKPVGLVTVPYIGRAIGGLWSRLESLGISTEFMAGVLTARTLERGIHFGLGSTLATTKTALAYIGGLAGDIDPLTHRLADDYELGARLHASGYHVAPRSRSRRNHSSCLLSARLLRPPTALVTRRPRLTQGRIPRPRSHLHGAVRPCLPSSPAAANSGASRSLSLALLLRVAVALTVGVGLLNDVQVLRFLLLLPLRDCLALFFWAWSYASDIVVWRGERFRLKRGKLEQI